jgi:hypothetical protein
MIAHSSSSEYAHMHTTLDGNGQRKTFSGEPGSFMQLISTHFLKTSIRDSLPFKTFIGMGLSNY